MTETTNSAKAPKITPMNVEGWSFDMIGPEKDRLETVLRFSVEYSGRLGASEMDKVQQALWDLKCTMESIMSGE